MSQYKCALFNATNGCDEYFSLIYDVNVPIALPRERTVIANTEGPEGSGKICLDILEIAHIIQLKPQINPLESIGCPITEKQIEAVMNMAKKWYENHPGKKIYDYLAEAQSAVPHLSSTTTYFSTLLNEDLIKAILPALQSTYGKNIPKIFTDTIKQLSPSKAALFGSLFRDNLSEFLRLLYSMDWSELTFNEASLLFSIPLFKKQLKPIQALLLQHDITSKIPDFDFGSMLWQFDDTQLLSLVSTILSYDLKMDMGYIILSAPESNSTQKLINILNAGVALNPADFEKILQSKQTAYDITKIIRGWPGLTANSLGSILFKAALLDRLDVIKSLLSIESYKRAFAPLLQTLIQSIENIYAQKKTAKLDNIIQYLRSLQ